MTYGERDTYDALVVKLENTCDENSLVCSIRKDRYPFIVTIQADTSMEGQMSMMESDIGFNGREMELSFIFYDGKLSQKANGMALSDTTINKLRNLAKKLYAAHTASYFRDGMTRKNLVDSMEEEASDQAGLHQLLAEDDEE